MCQNIQEIHWIYTYEELDGTIVEIVQDPNNKKCISCFQSDLDENCEEIGHLNYFL